MHMNRAASPSPKAALQLLGWRKYCNQSKVSEDKGVKDKQASIQQVKQNLRYGT